VVMDQFTRRIIGFGVHSGDVDGVDLCRMFNTATQPGVLRSISALITIRYSRITNGKRIFESWILMNSKAFPIRPARIPSLSDSSEPFAVSFLTTFYSGMLATW